MNLPSFFLMNQQAHFMTPGEIGFIPPWVFLFITILTFVILFPKFFSCPKSKIILRSYDLDNVVNIISPYLFAFFIGSLMQIFDDLSAFAFGPPFAHHSLFHSLLGSVITYFLFRIIATSDIAKYALLGNLTHTFFNFYFDYTTLFFPITYQEFGLTDILKIDTYWIKAIHYPLILTLFLYSTVRFFLRQKTLRTDS